MEDEPVEVESKVGKRKFGFSARSPSTFVTLEWVDWFNHRLLLAPTGNIPPAEAEQQYYAMLDDTAMAA